MTAISDIDISELLLQQPPFVMVDRLTDYGDDTTTAEYRVVEASNPFCSNGLVDAACLAEVMAQTCSARLGYYNRYILHKAVVPGVVGAISHMEIRRAPLVGELLTTTIRVRERVMNLMLIDATVSVGQEVIATAQMKFALKNDDKIG